MHAPSFIVWFADIDTHPTSTIGRAGKHIGNLVQEGFPMLPGFVITSDAYFAFLKQEKLEHRIKKLLTTLDYNQPESVYQVMEHIKKAIYETPLPDDLVNLLSHYYDAMDGHSLQLEAHSTTKSGHKVASHQVTEFGELVDSVKDAWIKHFEPNTHWKRHEHGHDHVSAGIEILVQMHIEPDMQGKIHTIDPLQHEKNVLYITHEHPHASDRYVLSKKTLTILDRHLNHHHNAPKLSHDSILDIASLGRDIEQHLYFPQEITWGITGDSLYVIQIKPLSTLPKAKQEKKKKLAKARGLSITKTIGTGHVKIIHTERQLNDVSEHDILIVKHLDTTHVKHLKKVRGIVSETGHKHSEVSALLRQLGIPTLFGVKEASKHFKDGHIITVHGGKGEIYHGSLH
jgi:pyruvate,water dikinase